MDGLVELRRLWGGFVDALLARVVSQLGHVLGYKLVMAGASASLHSLDERAHAAYVGLIKEYREIVEDYPGDGVFSILASRVRLAEESGLMGTAVIMEKNELVGKVLANMQRELRRLPMDEIRGVADILRDQVALSQEESRACYYSLVSGIETLSRPLYEAYCANTREFVSAINDLERRKAAAACFANLQQERDILESIVRIQLGELDRQEADDELRRALGRIRNAYQVFIKEADAVLVQLAAPTEEARPEPYESYDEDIKNKLNAPDGFPLNAFLNMSEKAEELVAGIRAEILERIEYAYKRRRSVMGKAIYELRKSLAQILLLSDEAASIFDGLHIYYVENEVALTEAGEVLGEISKGIDETIVIKTEAMAQGRAEFVKNSEQRIRMWTSEIGQVGAAAVAEVEELVDSLIHAPAEEAEAVLSHALGEFDSMGEIDAKVASWAAEFNKTTSQYLKDVLLYEMGSYEEIMNFSAKRLAEEADGSAPSMYADRLDEAWRALVARLWRDGIARIAPQPHDTFDAKQHDVLIAERTEGFVKGEVIRAVSSGYSSNGRVLARAAIIAAR